MQTEHHRPGRSAERQRLVERAFSPGATAADRRALADFDGRPPESHTRAPASPTGHGRTVAVAAAAAVLFGAAGLVGGLLLHDSRAVATPAADSGLTSVEKVLPAFVPPDYSGPQLPMDVPDVAIPANLVRSSFRMAGVYDTSPADPQRFFVAKDTTHYDCVVALHSGQLSSACVSGKYFPASGLTLSWEDGSHESVLTWLPDGTMTLTN